MDYYSGNLSGERLRECYEVAPPRVRQYLEAEIEHVLERIGPGDAVIELGCGYGRVALELTPAAKRVVGIDTASGSIALARKLAGARTNCEFLEMDAIALEFPDGVFDVTVCIQNGVCAFHVAPDRLLHEAARVTRSGGRVLMSSYAARFWKHRLRWFEIQADRGLVGEIDLEATAGNTIVCLDGFRSGAMSPVEFEELCDRAGLTCVIEEVDGSSVFCEVVVPTRERGDDR